MRSTNGNTHLSLTIVAISVLIARGEHLRADLLAGSGVGGERYSDSISTKLKNRGGHTEDRPMKPTVSGRKLLTSRELLTSSLYEPHSHGSHHHPSHGSHHLISKNVRSIRVLHMHIPKTAGGTFEHLFRKNNSAWAQFRKLAAAARTVDMMKSDLHNMTSENTIEPMNVSHAMESNLHNFTSENTRKPMNVSHVRNQSGMNLTFDDRDGQFPIATDIYLSNQSETNSTVDDLDEQFEVATDLLEALAKGEGLNGTSIEIAPVYQTLSVSRAYPSYKMTMISREVCLEKLLGTRGRELYLRSNSNTRDNDAFLVTLLREPVAHFQSMYNKCKNNWKGTTGGVIRPDERESLSDIGRWADHYIKIKNTTAKTAKWSCYDPTNIQTRAFSCKRDLWHDDVPGTQRTFEHAKEMMDLFDFVGISERFQESLCVFSAVVREHHHAKGPAWCNCSNTEAWASFDEDHHVRKTIEKHGHQGPSHQASDLNAKELEAIQQLTSEDDKLYKFATQRFDAQIAKYEAKGMLKLSC